MVRQRGGRLRIAQLKNPVQTVIGNVGSNTIRSDSACETIDRVVGIGKILTCIVRQIRQPINCIVLISGVSSATKQSTRRDCQSRRKNNQLFVPRRRSCYLLVHERRKQN